MAYAQRVEVGQQISLDDIDPREDGGLKRADGEKTTARLIEELVELQELLYAVRRQSVLIVLQGRDTSGKDGTIRHVIGPLNSQSCSVTSFKAPTEEELAHDFLWRVHAHTPRQGDIKVFNRSHYEDVLVVRVHGLVSQKVWRSRYKHINDFERVLADAGTVVLKFFLHISKEEQAQRLVEREKDPVKAWKLALNDWRERDHWDKYTEAYEDALHRCSTARAPWYVVPADRKWFRNLAVAEAIRDALAPFRAGWRAELEQTGVEKIKEIEEYRRSHNTEV